MKYFVEAGEDRQLDDRARQSLRGAFVELRDGVTHYELAGPAGGDVVVLTGGLTIPLFYWDGLIASMHNHGMRTLTYSAYGRGYSDRVRADYDDALFVRQLRELIESLGVESHHLVGTSMGALIAMGYVAEGHHPRTLTLVGPAGLSSPPAMRFLLRSDRLAGIVGKRFGRRLLEGHMGHNVRDAESATYLRDMVLDAFRYQGSMYALVSTLQNLPLFGRSELYRLTGGLGVPTMVVWGDEDRVTPISGLSTASDLLGARQSHVIRECGHMAPLERPSEVAALIAAFANTPAETA